MTNKKHFNAIEEKILRVLYNYGVQLTTYEIAKECGISFPTAKKYVKTLSERGFLKRTEIEGKDAACDGDAKFEKKEE